MIAMFGNIAAVWYLLSAIVALGMAAFLPKTRKPAPQRQVTPSRNHARATEPQPELSDREVDALFDLIVDRTLRDESNGGQS